MSTIDRTARELNHRIQLLEQNQEQLRLLMKHTPAAVAMLDLEMRYLLHSDRWLTDYGLGDRNIVGLCHYDVFPEIGDEWKKIHRRCLSGAVEHRDRDRFERADGSVTWVRWQIHPWRDGGGAIGGLVMFTEVITDQVRAEESLRASEARFLSAFEHAAIGMALVGIDGRFVRVNRALSKLVGYTEEELLARTFQDITHGEDLETDLGNVRRMLDGEITTYQIEKRYLHKRSRTIWVQLNVSLVRDGDGRPLYFISQIQDVTERKRAEKRVRHLNTELERRVRERTADLEAANQELEAFSYSVSHDLRAPLRGIDGFSRLLLDKYASRIDGDGQSYLQRVRAASQRMGNLIDELLKLSRLSRTELRTKPVDLSTMARAILSELQALEPDRDVQWEVADGLEAEGDPELLRVALDNLLGNAWKYTAKRPRATIAVGCQDRDDGPVFYVRDDGAGFDMAYATKLFGPFQRLHGATEFPGTGIGLALVQRIIRRHRGKVWAEAQVDKGATFYFALGPPRAEDAPEPPQDVLEASDVREEQ